jgi:HEXXH motif-containing protein
MKSKVFEEIQRFLNAPLPLWETDLTAKLVEGKYQELTNIGIVNKQSYSTGRALGFSDAAPNKQFLFSNQEAVVYMEKFDKETLADFYEEHGLLPITERTIIKAKAASQLKDALIILSLIPECIACVTDLVNCIQVVASEGPEYDTSYSHPKLPFTIFVSVCEDDSLNARLRVAESILHEAMHLKLSLIQEEIELVKPNTTATFFSPWRNVPRPLMGVLHGIFVFRAIQDFFKLIKDDSQLANRECNFAAYRISDIATDFQALQYFTNQKDLTKDGASLSTNLLPLN